MNKSVNSLIIDKADNVGVALETLKKGESAKFKLEDKISSIKIIEEIPVYHKFALKDIAKDSIVYKYGQNIGKATKDIKAGEHVHTHNLISVREGI